MSSIPEVAKITDGKRPENMLTPKILKERATSQ
jgi:hypothetical protein